MTIRRRLVLWYSATFALSGVLLVLVLYEMVAYRMDGEANNFLRDEYDETVRVTLADLDNLPRLSERIGREVGEGRMYPLVYRLWDADAENSILFLMTRQHVNRFGATVPIHGPMTETEVSYARVKGIPYRIRTGPLDVENHPHLVLQLGMDVSRLEEKLTDLRHYLFIAIASIAILAAVGGWLLASQGLKPFRQLIDEVARIEFDDLAQRLHPGAHNDEISQIRQAIIHMLGQLEAVFTSLRAFTSNAAHELRSPLAAAICRLETSVAGSRTNKELKLAVAEAAEQLGELARLVDTLLFVARMDARAALENPQRADVMEFVEQTCEPFAILAEQKDVALSVQGEGGQTVQAELTLLRRMLGNVIENAIRHTDAGGAVTVTVAGSGDACILTVADTGEGIAKDAVGHVFDRLYRADAGRALASGGAGIGLSIVKRIAELHGGRVELASEVGKGTVVTITLPASMA